MRHDDSSFNYILQFTHIARPVVILGAFDLAFGDEHGRQMKSKTGLLPCKMGEQIRNISATFSKRRNLHREDAQTIVQVESETALLDVVPQIAIGCGSNHPCVDTPRGFIADAFEFAFLQNAQQPGLQFNRDFAYFVKEQSAAIGQLESSDARSRIAPVNDPRT